MSTVLMGIGLPGSGKTTCLKPYAEKVGAGYLCPDDIRVEFALDPADQSMNREVWTETYKRIPHLLAASGFVVVDATNARYSDRVDLVGFARQFADHVEGAWFLTSFEECLHRNRKRNRQVPEHAMRRMAESLFRNPPQEKEGFTKIILVIP